MYILIKNDESKVLGYTVWTGFGHDASIKDSFGDVGVVSFENNEKSATVRLYSTKDYAFSESKRIAEIIKREHDVSIEFDIMPLQVYINHIERWK